MGAPKIIRPKTRLSQIMTEPGGPTVEEAVKRADENLRNMKPAASDGLKELLHNAGRNYEKLVAGFDGAVVADLYANASEGVGMGSLCGLPHVDAVLISLCELLDSLKSRRRNDHQAIAVHMGAWRLLMTANLPPAGVAAVLDGLRKVSSSYADARAAQAAGAMQS